MGNASDSPDDTALPAETALPGDVEYVRTTDVFDVDTVPAGLLRAHRVAAGVWARLVVETGAVTFVFEDEPDRPIEVGAGSHVVIPPERKHHLQLDVPVTFAVEFYREASGEAVDEGSESSGL